MSLLVKIKLAIIPSYCKPQDILNSPALSGADALISMNKYRSKNMAAIRSKDTEPERIVRSLLHRVGFRFRKNDSRLPGSPDIYLPRWRCVIFVHGCYWHRHKGCRFTTTPRTNVAFWKNKFKVNIDRDLRTECALTQLGMRVIVIWECEINTSPENVILRLKIAIKSSYLR